MAQINPKLRKATLESRAKRPEKHTYFLPRVGQDDHKNIPGMGYKRPEHPDRKKRFSGVIKLPIGQHFSTAMFGAKRISMQNLFDKQFITVAASREDKTVIMEIRNRYKLTIYYRQPVPFTDWVSIESQLAVGDYTTLDLLGCDNVHVRNACKCPISVKTSATRQILRFTVMEHFGG